ncbi:MAG: methyltransferase domain-containing protein [Mongoliibacter sp.]|uniref:methyltransferase domain-containing protein n=1 Tax=Mongoliibacter sp. TaxID=2022438 RepID=UPI0012F05162|nr:methyltransferase domain-containing protein [Mongoliibacter sp.]TVP46728.1 MAG: methyltransferase domain-containing protein [Mongoliibacter sp.]
MGKFTQRSTQKEIMDDLKVGGEELTQTLKELRTINKLLGGNHVTTSAIQRFRKIFPQEDYTIADVGCGGGDMLKVMADWAYKKELPCSFIGIDANPNIIRLAKKQLEEYKNVKFEQANVFSENFISQPVDIITCTLFTHHFTDEELIHLLSSFKNMSKLGVVINDLHRHPLAYYSIKLLTRFFSKSEMVKNDGPISVLRSFRREDWTQILSKAGFDHVEISWNWAFRWKILAY